MSIICLNLERSSICTTRASLNKREIVIKGMKWTKVILVNPSLAKPRILRRKITKRLNIKIMIIVPDPIVGIQ